MSRAKSQPTHKIVDGVEYFSIAAAAEALGRDKRTVTRLEKAGIVPHAEHVLPGDPRQRWYTADDLNLLRRVSDQTGFRTSRHRGKEFVAALAAEKQRRSEVGEKRTRPWQNLMGRFTQEEVRQTVRRWDDLERGDQPVERTAPEKVEASLCPCGRELIWVMQPVPGAADIQVPWCGRCGYVDLSDPPPPDPNVCAGCGADLVWEMSDPLVGFVPVCPSCGPVEVPKPARSQSDALQEKPFRHQVDFSGLGSVSTGRPRGLGPNDVVGAIRGSRRQPGPKIVFVDPHPGATRRG